MSMDPFRAEAIRLSLRRMFAPDHWFCIIDVQNCLKSAGIAAPQSEMDALRTLHCVHWSEMTPEMRAEVMSRTLALFSLPDMDFGDLDVPVLGSHPEASTSLFRRLLGKTAADA